MNKIKSGFTMIEIVISSFIAFILLSSVLTSFIASMKASRSQNLNLLAENLASEIIKTEVRNRPFQSKNKLSLCGNEDTVGTIANQLKNNTISVTSDVWNKTFSQDASTQSNYPLIYSELSKISENANAILEIRPINMNPSGSPVYSNSKVKIRAVVKWKTYQTVETFNEIQISTVASSNGLFDPVLQPIE